MRKVIEKITLLPKKYKMLLLIFVVAISLGVFLLSRTLRGETNKVDTEPTSVPYRKPESLMVLEISPKQGKITYGGLKNAITVKFNAEIDPKTVRLNSSPHIDLTPVVHPNELDKLILTPKSEWVDGETYVITLEKGIKSVEGRYISNEDLVLEYIITSKSSLIPTYPPFEKGY